VPYWVIAIRNERAFTRAYDALGCLPPTYEPRATGHIPEMVALMQRLIDSGHAYAAAAATSTSTCGPGRGTAP
jgi:cysteinyl-tRNA synthetase